MTRSHWHNSAVRIALPLLLLAWLFIRATAGLAQRQWNTPDHAYSPYLLAIALVLLVVRVRGIQFPLHTQTRDHAFAWLMLLGGLLGYSVGEALHVDLITMTGCILLLGGAVTWLGGLQALRQLRFPLVFLCLSLPLPGWLIDRLTSPMKLWVSQAAESVVYALGYPVARSGVVLAIGPYRLLVADACSGLHSLIFLVALGLLYLHLTGPRSGWHRAVVTLALMPIAILANSLRVTVLMLVTYHWGDGAGQSYWHTVAGLLLYAAGFISLLVLDAAISRIAPHRLTSFGAGASIQTVERLSAALPWSRALWLTALLALTATATRLLAPTYWLAQANPMPPLAEMIPARLGQWQLDVGASKLSVEPASTQASLRMLYSQTLARTYVNPSGQRIMLSVAYGGQQMGDDLQAHRPEYCYQAQGFDLIRSQDTLLTTGGKPLMVRRLVAIRHERVEPITYWMTVGATPTLPGWQRKWAQIRHGLARVVPDGVLVRISSLSANHDDAFSLQADFVEALGQVGLGRLGL